MRWPLLVVLPLIYRANFSTVRLECKILPIAFAGLSINFVSRR